MSNDKKIFLEQTPQEVLNVLEALQFYKDSVVKPNYQYVIDNQLSKINTQLQLQNVNVYCKQYNPDFKVGQVVEYDDHTAIVLSPSDKNSFIKIVISNNNKLEVIDVPIVSIIK
jgi:hypothetical protein